MDVGAFLCFPLASNRHDGPGAVGTGNLKKTKTKMDTNALLKSPMMLLAEGLPLHHPVAALHYQDLLHMMKAGMIDIVQRPGCSGHFLELTAKDEAPPVSPIVENTAPAKLQPGMVRFKDVKINGQFRIQVSGSKHKLRFKKVSDGEEDNAMTDTETPEPCSFPEDQPVFPDKPLNTKG